MSRSKAVILGEHRADDNYDKELDGREPGVGSAPTHPRMMYAHVSAVFQGIRIRQWQIHAPERVVGIPALQVL